MFTKNKISGQKGFTIVWIGQMFSVIASSMTTFGMTLWMYKQTGSVTAMGIMQVAHFLPFLILTPIAGVMVDKYNRKLMMMISDLGAILSTIVILIMYMNGNLEFWHLYFAAVCNGIGNAFQKPAYSAVISTMIPKKQYGRFNGLMELLRSGPDVIAPALAGTLLAITLHGIFDSFALILVIDVITFFLAVGSLLLVNIPQPYKSVEGEKASGNLFKESFFGFKYIFERPSLLGIMMIYLIGNLFVMIGYSVFAPMILARTGQNSLIYGTVQTARAAGGIIGGILMSTWAGFKLRIHGVLVGWIFLGVSILIFGLGTHQLIWITAMIIFSISVALTNTSGQAIWQSKVPHDLQGRVFASRTLLAWFTRPVGPIIGGVLADYVMEPAMQTESFLSEVFGPIFGFGPGAGMGLVIFLSSIGVILVSLSGYLFQSIRNVEKILPDHDTVRETVN